MCFISCGLQPPSGSDEQNKLNWIIENWNKYIEKNCAPSWSFTMNAAFCPCVIFVVGGCKLKPGLELILYIAEVHLKASVFLTTNVGNENIHWE